MEHESAKKRLLDFYNTPGFIGVCICNQSNVIGCVIGNIESYFKGDYFYLKEMFISCERQRKGLGRTLIQTLFSKLDGKQSA